MGPCHGYGMVQLIRAQLRNVFQVETGSLYPALGADSANVVRMVLRQGLSLAAAGTGFGLVGALLTARAIAEVLVGESPTDPLTFGAAIILLTTAACVGCLVPARRAIRVAPIVALHY
jgi:ABC-type antimicrobial peptide transport system permease subunit